MKIKVMLDTNKEVVFENADASSFVENGSFIKIVTGDTVDYIPIKRINGIRVEH